MGSNMFYTYILRSQKTGKHYYGSCEDLEKRLKTHNAGKVKYTKPFIPWEIIYSEQFDTRSEAYRRELFFKTLTGWNWLKDKGILQK
jgi:putative endonuclease